VSDDAIWISGEKDGQHWFSGPFRRVASWSHGGRVMLEYMGEPWDEVPVFTPKVEYVGKHRPETANPWAMASYRISIGANLAGLNCEYPRHLRA
jgi:hypothetical protein